MTVADRDGLVRLEEFLREEGKAQEQTKIIVEWRDAPSPDDGSREGGGEPATERP